MANGKTYGSKFAAFRVNVRPPADVVHPSTGVVINKIPALVAEFGLPGAEYRYQDADGNDQIGVDIFGHYFDTGSAQEKNGWTDDERETVERVLDAWCERWPEAIWQHSKAPAAKPWPKYDETHHNQVATLAEQLGLVNEALAYEQENKARPAVLEKLSELLSQTEVEGALTAA